MVAVVLRTMGDRPKQKYDTGRRLHSSVYAVYQSCA